jgi:hypothetical protein
MTEEMSGNHKPAKSGYEFLKSLYYLLKNARIYRDDNELMQRCVVRFQSAFIYAVRFYKAPSWQSIVTGQMSQGVSRLSHGLFIL